jgi:hypothetical protein
MQVSFVNVARMRPMQPFSQQKILEKCEITQKDRESDAFIAGLFSILGPIYTGRFVVGVLLPSQGEKQFQWCLQTTRETLNWQQI